MDLQIVAHTSMDSSTAEEDPSIHIQISPNCIPIVDIRRFSQSELLSFSAASSSSSSSSYDFCRLEEDLVLKIDRSSFKESAGSRRQTYSRLRLAPRKTEFQSNSNSLPSHSSHSHRFPIQTPQTLDENCRIVKCLRDLFAVEDDGEGELFSIDIQYDEFLSHAENINNFVEEVDVIEIGRKRRRITETDTRIQISANECNVYSEKKPRESSSTKNDNIVALANVESPYDCELRKITWGLKTEAELLHFGVQWIIPMHYKEIYDQLWLTSNPYIRPNGQLLLHFNKISSFLSSIWGFRDADQSISSTRGYTFSVYSILPDNASELACHVDGENNEAVKTCLNIQNENHFPLKVTSAGISVDRICSVMFFSKDDFLNNLQVIYNNSPKVGNVRLRNYYHYHVRNYVEDILKVMEWESERAVKKRNNLYFIELSYTDSETPVFAGVYENKYHICTYPEHLERYIHQNTRVFELVQQSSKGFGSIEEIRELLLYFLEKLL